MAETNYNPITKLRDLNITIDNIDPTQPSSINPSQPSSIDPSQPSSIKPSEQSESELLQKLIELMKGGERRIQNGGNICEDSEKCKSSNFEIKKKEIEDKLNFFFQECNRLIGSFESNNKSDISIKKYYNTFFGTDSILKIFLSDKSSSGTLFKANIELILNKIKKNLCNDKIDLNEIKKKVFESEPKSIQECDDELVYAYINSQFNNPTIDLYKSYSLINQIFGILNKLFKPTKENIFIELGSQINKVLNESIDFIKEKLFEINCEDDIIIKYPQIENITRKFPTLTLDVELKQKLEHVINESDGRINIFELIKDVESLTQEDFISYINDLHDKCMPEKKRECINLFNEQKLLDRQKYENKIGEIAPASGKNINQSDLELYTKLKGCNYDCNMFNPRGTKLNTYEITPLDKKKLDKKKILVNFTAKEDSSGALILDNPGNGNGSNYCWLNAPLYAIVAYPDFLSFYENECDREITDGSSVIFNIPSEFLDKYIFTVGRIDANNVTLSATKTGDLETQNLKSKLKELYVGKFESNFIEIEGKINFSSNLENLKLKPLVNSEDRKNYDKIIEILNKSRNPETIWNDVLYKELHKEICGNAVDQTSGCNTLSTIIRDVDSGNYSNPIPVLNKLTSVINNNCPNGNIKIQTYFLDESNTNTFLEYENLQSFVMGTSIIDSKPSDENLTKDINLGHFITFVKVGEQWKKYDSGKTIENLLIDDINTVFNHESGKHYIVLGVYFNRDFKKEKKPIQKKKTIASVHQVDPKGTEVTPGSIPISQSSMKRRNSLITTLDYDCGSNEKGKFCIKCNIQGDLIKLLFDGIEYDTTIKKSNGRVTYPLIMGEGAFGKVIKYSDSENKNFIVAKYFFDQDNWTYEKGISNKLNEITQSKPEDSIVTPSYGHYEPKSTKCQLLLMHYKNGDLNSLFKKETYKTYCKEKIIDIYNYIINGVLFYASYKPNPLFYMDIKLDNILYKINQEDPLSINFFLGDIGGFLDFSFTGGVNQMAFSIVSPFAVHLMKKYQYNVSKKKTKLFLKLFFAEKAGFLLELFYAFYRDLNLMLRWSNFFNDSIKILDTYTIKSVKDYYDNICNFVDEFNKANTKQIIDKELLLEFLNWNNIEGVIKGKIDTVQINSIEKELLTEEELKILDQETNNTYINQQIEKFKQIIKLKSSSGGGNIKDIYINTKHDLQNLLNNLKKIESKNNSKLKTSIGISFNKETQIGGSKNNLKIIKIKKTNNKIFIYTNNNHKILLNNNMIKKGY